MVTRDRFRGFGQDSGIVDLGPDPMGGEIGWSIGSGGWTTDPTPVTDATGSTLNWAGALNNVGIAMAPAVKNLTTPYATYQIGPYGRTATVPLGTGGAGMAPLGASFGQMFSGSSSGIWLIGGIAILLLMMGTRGGRE